MVQINDKSMKIGTQDDYFSLFLIQEDIPITIITFLITNGKMFLAFKIFQCSTWNAFCHI